MLGTWGWHLDVLAFLLAALVLSSSRTPHEAHVNCGEQKKHVHMRARTLAGCMLAVEWVFLRGFTFHWSATLLDTSGGQFGDPWKRRLRN